MTLSWPRLTCPALADRQAGPWSRKMSATSRAGRDKRPALLRRRRVLVSLLRLFALAQPIEGALDRRDQACGDTRVTRRRLQFLMSEKGLDRPSKTIAARRDWRRTIALD